MIYKYTKCESVIAKIMADSNMSEKNMRVTDIREWIFEAVEKIGAPMQYIEKESGVDEVPVFKITDYQVPIPGDLVYLNAVAYGSNEEGPFVPVRSNDSQFKQQHQHKMHRRHEFYNYEVPCIHEHKHEGFVNKPIKSQEQLYNSMYGCRFSDKDDMIKKDVTFFVKPGWIVLNKQNGFVKLQYKAIATDERGYPLIPDLPSYQEAVYWYVMMKLTFPKWLNSNFETKRAATGAQYAYTYIQQQWNFYRNQAYAEAMMPTESEMRSIKNEWNKLVPEWDSDEVFFKPEGSKTLNYTDYYYGY